MEYYGGKELAAAFRTVRENTIKIAEDVPEDKYDFRATPDTRTVAQMLAHIAIGPRFQHHIHSNKISDMATVNFPELFERFTADENKRRTKAELIGFLKSEGDTFAAFLEGLPEAFLRETITMPPQAGGAIKTRFEMLLGAKEHEMHHRAQLMTIQRLIGQVPHLTRRMQERMAQAMAAQQQPAAQR